MRGRIYWGFLILIVLIGIGGVLFIRHNLSEVSKFEQGAADADKQIQVVGKTPLRVSDTTATYQPPPPGETEDTGYWEGNTWHRVPPPEPVKQAWWKDKDPEDLYFMVINGSLPDEYIAEEGGYHDYAAFDEYIIKEYPNSRAAFEARWQRAIVAITEGNTLKLRSMLKYYPDSPRVNASLAYHSDTYEEAVAFAKKTFELLEHTSEDYSEFHVLDLPRGIAHKTLGRTYQRLGDYKSALVHLKAYQSILLPEMSDSMVRSTYEAFGEDIAAIKAGKPRFPPIPDMSGVEEPFLGVSEPNSVLDLSEKGTSVDTSSVEASRDASFSDVSRDDLPTEPPTRFDRLSQDIYKNQDLPAALEERRRAFAAKQAKQSQEFEGFLRWLEAIETARSPADLDDFLMREMGFQLQGSGSEYSPDRLIRAFETLQREGKSAGMTKLKRLDPDIARAMSEQQKRRGVSPRPSTNRK